MVLAVSGKVFATGVDVILNDTSGASAFTIKNSNSVEVAHIASDGGMQLTSPESGGKLIWKANKIAFRAGVVHGTQWDDANIGFLSIGTGYNALASGGGSVAMGDGPTASGASAVAMGYKTTASGDNSFAMGASSTASGSRAVAMGYQSTASGNLSIAMGGGATASGGSSFAVGKNSTAEGSDSVAIGAGAVASGNKAFAIGENVTAGQSGIYGSYAIGRNVSATVANSFVIGVGDGSPLVNNMQNSLMVGFLSTTPVLFVSNNGVAMGNTTSSPNYILYLPNDATKKAIAQAWDTHSSRRWKENVEPVNNALEKVCKLQGVYFDWKKDYGGKHDIGLIAEDVGQIFPEVVSYEQNGIDAKGLNYDRLTAVLVEAVKELNAKNNLLESRNQELENRVKVLEDKIK